MMGTESIACRWHADGAGGNEDSRGGAQTRRAPSLGSGIPTGTPRATGEYFRRPGSRLKAAYKPLLQERNEEQCDDVDDSDQRVDAGPRGSL